MLKEAFKKARISPRMPETQNKRCCNWARSLKRWSVRLSDQAPEAYRACSLSCSFKQTVISSAQFFSGSNPFHQKTQILISQCPNLFPKVVYRYMYIKRHSKSYRTWNQNIISTIPPSFTKTLNNSSIHTTIP